MAQRRPTTSATIFGARGSPATGPTGVGSARPIISRPPAVVGTLIQIDSQMQIAATSHVHHGSPCPAWRWL